MHIELIYTSHFTSAVCYTISPLLRSGDLNHAFAQDVVYPDMFDMSANILNHIYVILLDQLINLYILVGSLRLLVIFKL